MGQLAYGTLLKVGDAGTPESFAAVAKVSAIKPPNVKVDVVDDTTHDSPDSAMESIPGLIDGGEVTFDVNFTPGNATHDNTSGLVYLALNRLTRNWKIVLPDAAASTWSFRGFISQFSPDAPVKDLLKASVSIKITGKPTLARTL